MVETTPQLIKTTNTNQLDIIRDIQRLYVPEGFELDPTYSKGKFYEKPGVITPTHKYDLYPQRPDVLKATAEDLPFDDASINSIMFDPPFMAGYTKAKPTGVMGERFHGFRYVTEMWEWYDACLAEFSRILKPGGILTFKCQDTVSGGKNWFSHSYVMNCAIEKGFYPRDMFVLVAKNRMIGHNHANQKHARKFHSYFWVFEKEKEGRQKINYNLRHESDKT